MITISKSSKKEKKRIRNFKLEFRIFKMEIRKDLKK